MSCTPCLSLWERWLSEAKTERAHNGRNTLSVTFGDSSPKGRAKGCTPLYKKWSASVPIRSIHCFMATH